MGKGWGWGLRKSCTDCSISLMPGTNDRDDFGFCNQRLTVSADAIAVTPHRRSGGRLRRGPMRSVNSQGLPG